MNDLRATNESFLPKILGMPIATYTIDLAFRESYLHEML